MPIADITQRKMIQNSVEDYGFDATFQTKFEYGDVKDKRFHTLRKNYLKVGKEFKKYLQIKD